MSVYRPKNSPFYHYDFQVSGVRFHGSTGSTRERDAKTIERARKEEAHTAAKASKAAGNGPLTLDLAVDRYWLEVGSLRVNPKTTWTDLARIIDFLGPSRLLSDITDDDVARLVQWRRTHRKNGRTVDRSGKPVPLVGAATVNRSTTEVLKKIFTRARRTWKQTLPLEPSWHDHMLAEPRERVRELKHEEGARLTLATRADYEPILAYARTTGMRKRECLLRWSEVDWAAGRISKTGKGGKLVTTGITPAIRNIIEPLIGQHAEFVFTYVAVRTRGGRRQGERYPITYSGLASQWTRLREKAGVLDFRFHDFRHDVGTKLLRQTGNLKLVQKALNHSDIKTTSRYAHVLDDEVSSAMQKLAESQSSDAKSRNESRTRKLTP